MQFEKTFRASWLLLVACLVLSCATLQPQRPHLALVEVERPKEAKQRYGEQTVATTQEEGVTKYVFEDDMVRTVWYFGSKDISLLLSNKTDHSIKIIWDEAAYVDHHGASHRCMHSGVKYTDRNNPQPPTVVPRKGMITDIIVPTDNVAWVANSWYTYDLFMKADSSLVGDSVQVLLPLEIEDVVNEYIFSFEVERISRE